MDDHFSICTLVTKYWRFVTNESIIIHCKQFSDVPSFACSFLKWISRKREAHCTCCFSCTCRLRPSAPASVWQPQRIQWAPVPPNIFSNAVFRQIKGKTPILSTFGAQVSLLGVKTRPPWPKSWIRHWTTEKALHLFLTAVGCHTDCFGVDSVQTFSTLWRKTQNVT